MLPPNPNYQVVATLDAVVCNRRSGTVYLNEVPLTSTTRTKLFHFCLPIPLIFRRHASALAHVTINLSSARARMDLKSLTVPIRY